MQLKGIYAYMHIIINVILIFITKFNSNKFNHLIVDDVNILQFTNKWVNNNSDNNSF